MKLKNKHIESIEQIVACEIEDPSLWASAVIGKNFL